MGESKLLHAIDPCVRIFEFCGYANLTIRKDVSLKQNHRALWILTKYLIIFVVLAMMFIDSMMGRLESFRDSNGVTIHLLFFLGTYVETFTCVIQSLVCSSKYLKFMRKMEAADELLVKFLSVKIDYDDLRWQLLINLICSFGAYIIGIITVVSLLILNYPERWRVLPSFFVPFIFMRIFMQRFVFFVQLLATYLDAMINVVKKSISQQPLLVRKEEKKRCIWLMKRNHAQTKILRKVYRHLWEASVLINQCFNASVAFVMLMNMVLLLYQGYLMCVDIANNQVNYRQYVWIIMQAVAIFNTHYHCQHCLNSVIFDD